MQYNIGEQTTERSRQGLFVVVKEKTHKFSFDPQKKEDIPWYKRPVLDYDTDETRILEAFGLQRPLGKSKGSANLLLGEDLTNASKGDKSFDRFMSKVCKYRLDTLKPAFVMLFLMSHGFENGNFLLADHGTKKFNQKAKVPKVECCEKHSEHRLKKSCFARNVEDHVIDKICKAFPDDDIPKIFFIQTCRGKEDKNLEQLHKPLCASDDTSETELFLEKYRNTFVFRASVEGYVSYAMTQPTTVNDKIKKDKAKKDKAKKDKAKKDKAKKDQAKKGKLEKEEVMLKGSMLIQGLYETIKELKESYKQFQNLHSRIEQHRNSSNVDARARTLQGLDERREDVTGGWMMNVCQRSTTRVTNFLLVNIILPETGLGKLLHYTKTSLEKQSQQDIQVLRHMLINGLLPITETLLTVAETDMVKKECMKHPWPILEYLWEGVRKMSGTYPLRVTGTTTDKDELKSCLDLVIKQVQQPLAHAKQQPHISSSLSKKLSMIQILRTQDAIDGADTV